MYKIAKDEIKKKKKLKIALLLIFEVKFEICSRVSNNTYMFDFQSFGYSGVRTKSLPDKKII